MTTKLEVAVVGAGQAGLAMGYYLSRARADFACFDSVNRPGQSWRDRYDSLRLFTPSQYDALPGLPFPAPVDHYPSKEEVAVYLERYAESFHLPLRLGVRVHRLDRVSEGFRLETSSGDVHARAVVVATGGYGSPYVPSFSKKLAPNVMQIHASEYRRPNQLGAGVVVVVGTGNSGLQIASELAPYRRVLLAQGTRQIVFPQRLLGRDIFHWFERFKFTDVPARSLLGRLFQRSEPIVGESVKCLASRLEIELRPRIVDATGRVVHFADGSHEPVDTVVWATGYRPNYSWIDAAVLDAGGKPIQRAGISSIPGLFFLGLRWMTARGSSLLGWVGRDAQRLLPDILRV